MNNACCGFGHRDYYREVDLYLRYDVFFALTLGYNVFYTGGMGAFDRAFAEAVRSWKPLFPNIKLILVIPYLTKELQRNKDYYESMYDSIVKPAVLDGVHPKAAIKKRNVWMVNNSSLIISYTPLHMGGAYEAVNYAKQNEKAVIEIPKSSIGYELLRGMPNEKINGNAVLKKLFTYFHEKRVDELAIYAESKTYVEESREHEREELLEYLRKIFKVIEDDEGFGMYMPNLEKKNPDGTE